MKDEANTSSSSLHFKTKDGQPFDIPAEGSLGLLALGYVGLMAWREKRRVVNELHEKESEDKV